MVIVRVLKSASQFGSDAFMHCSYWALDSATSDESKLSALKSRDQVSNALKANLKVIAVSAIEFLVPYSSHDAMDSHRRYVVGGYVTVKVSPRGKFYDWVMRELMQGATQLDERDVCREIYARYGLGDFFNGLVNSENVEALVRHGKGATVFQDIPTHLPDWCDFGGIDSFRIVDTQVEVIPETILLASAAKAEAQAHRQGMDDIVEMGRNIWWTWFARGGKYLAEHPFKAIGGMVGVALAAYLLTGWISDAAKQREAKEAERNSQMEASQSSRWVEGLVSVVRNGEDGVAWKILHRDAETFLNDLFRRESNGTKSWTNGAKVAMRADRWERIAVAVADFAAKSDGDYGCETSKGRRTKLVANVRNVPRCTIDVAALKGDAELVGAVAKTFGVEFGGSDSLSGVPVRACGREAAIKQLAQKAIRGEDRGERIVCFPDVVALAVAAGLPKEMGYAEIEKRAAEFWAAASARFGEFPAALKTLQARFAPLDRKYAAGFDEAEAKLRELISDVSAKQNESGAFAAQCDAKWLKFSANAPADRERRIREVRDAIKGMSALKSSAEARYVRVAFDKDIAAFDAAKSNPVTWGVKMIECHNAQQARIGAVRQILQEIGLAKETRDFTKIASFGERLAQCEKVRLEKRQYEMQVGQYVQSVCQESYFGMTFGKEWVRAMNKRHGARIPEAATVAAQKSADFANEIVRLYQAANLEKALKKGAGLSAGVIDNHREAADGKTVDSMGAEVAAIHQVRSAIAVLERIRRKSAAR